MYWDPFEDLDRMHQDMDRMFGGAWGRPRRKMLGTNQGNNQLAPRNNVRAPRCHMHETENSVVAAFELPGAHKGDIDLVVEDDYMEIKVDSKQKREQGKKGEEGYTHSTFMQSFYRRIPLPVPVESEKAKASYKDGVLRVEVPKKDKGKKEHKKVNIE